MVMTRLFLVAAAGAALLLMPTPIAASSRPTNAVVKMELSIKPTQTKYGKLGGYDPVVLTVHVGDHVRWKNVDGQTHTATSRGFEGDGRVTTGSRISPKPWSSGDVRAHQKSREFLATAPGVYYYSCGYHFSLGQRGVIVVHR